MILINVFYVHRKFCNRVNSVMSYFIDVFYVCRKFYNKVMIKVIREKILFCYC